MARYVRFVLGFPTFFPNQIIAFLPYFNIVEKVDKNKVLCLVMECVN